MDIKQFTYFSVIAKSSSLSEASQILGVSQPSLSQIVQRMENELNVTLVVRSPRGISLTEEGEVLLRHAHRICREFERCMGSMKDLASAAAGQVSFGMPPSVTMVLATPLVETVLLELSDVQLKVIEAISGYFVPWLEEGIVDVAMLYHTDGIEHLETRHILDEQLYFCSAPDAWPFDFTPENGVAFKQLENVDMVLPSIGFRKTIQNYEREFGVKLNVVQEMDALRQLIELVTRGSAYGIFTASAVNTFYNRGELIRAPIIDPLLVLPVYLVWPKDGKKTRACRAVEELTLEIIRELVDRGFWEAKLI